MIRTQYHSKLQSLLPRHSLPLLANFKSSWHEILTLLKLLIYLQKFSPQQHSFVLVPLAKEQSGMAPPLSAAGYGQMQTTSGKQKLL